MSHSGVAVGQMLLPVLIQLLLFPCALREHLRVLNGIVTYTECRKAFSLRILCVAGFFALRYAITCGNIR
jgi:hypothetical protein